MTDSEGDPGIEARDEQGVTPLLLAGLCLLAEARKEGARAARGVAFTCVEYLLQSAADPKARAHSGVSFLDVLRALEEVTDSEDLVRDLQAMLN